MAKLTEDDIRHLAALSRIKLTADDVALFQSQLSKILDYVEQLEAVDTVGLEPTSQVTGLSHVTRPDGDNSDTMERDKLLEAAPATDGQNLKVPKVL